MKEFEDEDPMELVGVALPDPEGEMLTHMARCLVEEYFMMGYGAEEILGLFQNPFYRVPYEIYRQKGEDYLKDIIEEVFKEVRDA